MHIQQKDEEKEMVMSRRMGKKKGDKGLRREGIGRVQRGEEAKWEKTTRGEGTGKRCEVKNG